MAALFLIKSVMLWYLRHYSCLKAWAITASLLMYGFYSILKLKVEEKVLIVRASLTCLYVLIIALNLTIPCHAKLLIVTYATLFMSSCLIISILIEVYTLFSYNVSVNKLMAFISFISISLSAFTT
jgi:hypothetical protein